MRFELLDRIERIDATRVVGLKQVSQAEEYLADHFPTFPVLPGVLMLEAGVQACSWLMHHRSSFARPIAVLKEARNVKYGHFVAPGRVLRVEAEWSRDTPGGAQFKVTGTVNTDSGDKTAFSARIDLAYFSLAEKQPELGYLDAPLTRHARNRWAEIAPKNNATPATIPL
jgi:3-hydroxyacyl-[acyl-carrier-protein] dehydratase